jgi:hypothetical protein
MKIALFLGMTCSFGVISCGEGVLSQNSLATLAQEQARTERNSLDPSRIELFDNQARSHAESQPNFRTYSRDFLFPTSLIPDDFCHGLLKGECFTLNIRIPAPSLEKNFGLATLTLALHENNYKAAIERACNDGLSVSARLATQGKDLLSKFLWNTKRARCLVEIVDSESVSLPALAKNEVGLSVRLVDFGVENAQTESNPALGKFTFHNAKLSAKFRDVYATHGESGDEIRSAWKPVAGRKRFFAPWTWDGVFETSKFHVAFAKEVSLQFDGAKTIGYVGHLIGPVLDAARSTRTLGPLAAQLSLIKDAVGLISSGSNPMVGGLILAGIGIDAIKDLCSFEGSDCTPTTSSLDINALFQGHLGAADPVPSETKAMFLDALKHFPMAILRSTSQKAEPEDLLRTLNVPVEL